MKVIVVETLRRDMDVYFQDERAGHIAHQSVLEAMADGERSLVVLEGDGSTLTVWSDEITSLEYVDVGVFSMMREQATVEDHLGAHGGVVQ